ncbi:hypothetical protein [Paenibacillus naphthalenovorans]|uniref:hypothetical protein n=1 Tax=Paenibacillus naphthalenovorans TaxID=162209 RepID=UPI003D29A338
MRCLIQVIAHELDGVRFMALNLFDDRGQHADQIVKPADDFEIVDAITDMLRIHGIDTVDVETDNEAVFKVFLAVPGVNVRFVLASDLRPLYELFNPHSVVWPMISELFLPEAQPSEKVTLWRRFLHFLGGLIRRCKNGN